MNDFDILLFSETWISSKQTTNLGLNGFYCEHLFGQKTPGLVKGRYSGGISFYVKNNLKNMVKVIEKNPMGLLWIKLSSDLFTFNEDVYICNVYIPPSDSRVFQSFDYNFWDEIEKGIEQYSVSGKVYISGDMNGRTSNFSDILNFDRFLENNDLFTDTSHIPMRFNKDLAIDSHGRKLLDMCKSTGYIIANGRLGEDCGIVCFCLFQFWMF